MISRIRIAFATVLLAINSIVHILPLLAFALIKLLVPLAAVRKSIEWILMRLAESWIGFNSFMFRYFTSTRVRVTGTIPDARDGHFLVICNHQSWVDIPVLQMLLNRKLPLLRFFLKSQLIWIPLLGLAWWALDFPFMKRYSKEALAKRPQLAGRDIEATRKACRKFRHIPVAIMNFVEGTRFSRAKHGNQRSPYNNLLKPRSGGIAFVLDAMGDSIERLIDVTIVYPAGQPTLFDLFANRVPEIHVDIRERPIPEDFRHGDYQNDNQFRRRFQQWINAIWAEKDQRIEQIGTSGKS